ncbi:hypothetical protein [Pseudescherichia vulneris]|nr:hypothetical protein [Pseudescherichia vulneris]STQ60151.1 Uncharacterised protein [Pseudescherichia vulneris]
MASKSLWAIVDYLRENQTVTPRQVQALLGCDCKKAHNLLLHLIRRSVVLRAGEPHHPVFTLVPDGEFNIKRPKPAAPPAPAKPAAKAKPQAKAAKASARPSIADICRQNWQGYKIHKIFGSARA